MSTHKITLNELRTIVRKIIIEEIKNDVKVGDKIKHKRTGVIFIVDKIDGNTIEGIITDVGSATEKYIKIGNRNKTSKNAIGVTYEIIK